MKHFKFILLIIFMSLLTTGCFEEAIAQKEINKIAINYFSSKYNISKKNIEIEQSNFYKKDQRCWMACGENQAKITYKDKTYIIEYNNQTESFGDNYQYEEINNDLTKYLLEKFPFATTIKINMLEHDVLAIPEKYTGNIENYIKNFMVKIQPNKGVYTDVKIWIEVTDSTQAKELHNQYKKTLITVLDNLDISYEITFAKNENDNEYFALYYYNVSVSGRKPAFMFWDRVDKNDNRAKTKTCTSKDVTFNDDEIVCQ